MNSKKGLVKDALSEFLSGHSCQKTLRKPNRLAIVFNSINDAVLSYVISILEDLGDKNCVDTIDADNFKATMDSFIPGFKDIESVEVVGWMLELSNALRKTKTSPDLPWVDLRSTFMSISPNGSTVPEEAGTSEQLTPNVTFDDEKLKPLSETFPDVCTAELKHCWTVSKGDVDTAAQLVIQRQESGNSVVEEQTEDETKKKRLIQKSVACQDDLQELSRSSVLNPVNVREIDWHFHDYSQHESKYEISAPSDSGSCAPDTSLEAEAEVAKIGHLITAFHPLLVEHIKCTHLLTYLDFMRDDAARIIQKNKESPMEATKLFLNILSERFEEPGTWQAFLDALEHAGYTYVVKVLKGDPVQTDHRQEHMNIIEIFRPSIEARVMPEELVPRLLSRGLISDQDKEEIMCTATNRGKMAAAFVLLDCIHRRKENWYEEFLTVLLDSGHDDIVKLVDPIFIEKNNACHTEVEMQSWSSNVESVTDMLPQTDTRRDNQHATEDGSDVPEAEASVDRATSSNCENSYNSEDHNIVNYIQSLHQLIKDLNDKLDDLRNGQTRLEQKVDRIELKVDQMTGNSHSSPS